MEGQTRKRWLIKHESGEYLNRMADGLTNKMFSAIHFSCQTEAEHFLESSMYSPGEPGYIVIETITEIREVESSGQHGDLREIA